MEERREGKRIVRRGVWSRSADFPVLTTFNCRKCGPGSIKMTMKAGFKTLILMLG